MTATWGAELLGLGTSMVVQGLGWDEDTGPNLYDEIVDATDTDMIEDVIEMVNAVVPRRREDDGDAVYGLVGAMKDLAPTSFIWLLIPKAGRSGYTFLSDLAKGTVTVGLSLTSSVNISSE